MGLGRITYVLRPFGWLAAAQDKLHTRCRPERCKANTVLAATTPACAGEHTDYA